MTTCGKDFRSSFNYSTPQIANKWFNLFYRGLKLQSYTTSLEIYSTEILNAE